LTAAEENGGKKSANIGVISVDMGLDDRHDNAVP
jgi:hypothetical protein